MRASISELENRQVKCEGKLSEMIVSAQEYAHLLEEAQDTIHSLSETRLESDIENLEISPGRSRGHVDKSINKVNILSITCFFFSDRILLMMSFYY